MMSRSLLLLLLLCSSFAGFSQSGADLSLQHLRDKAVAFKLTTDDVADLRLQSTTGEAPGLQHFYFIQRHAGVDVYNAIYNTTLKGNKVIYAGNRLEAQLSSRIQGPSQPQLSAQDAVAAALTLVGGTHELPIEILSREDDQHLVFKALAQTSSDIPVQLCFQLMDDGKFRLAWSVGIDLRGGSDFWSIRVDAQTGLLLNKNSWTNHCTINKGQYHAAHAEETAQCTEAATYKVFNTSKLAQAPMPLDASVYNVFPWPTESPSHGPQVLVTNPANPIASPYGWHDTNEAEGAEYTYTRGNNVYAFKDDNNDDVVDTDFPVPNGGAALNFNFPYSPTAEPQGNRDAAIVNLFYNNNMMHDFAAVHGFDEAAGNFQFKNYSQGGGNDPVLAQALDGASLNPPNVNNANFATPPDGLSPRMQMFIWTASITELVHITAPSALAGLDLEAGSAAFGTPIDATPIMGVLQLVNDGTSSPTLACSDIIETLAGKIAVIDRGECDFSAKVYRAQQQGAIAAMVCNFGEQILTMASGDNGSLVTIPAVFLPSSSCNTIKQYLDAGVTVSLFQEEGVLVPDAVDADFDNGIISHEYGHGISNRLTGGPSNSGCLSNQENMGEGWSDFFALVIQVKPGDVGETPKGTGTFSQRQDPNGTGIRRFRYSTDMGVNPQTYGLLAQSTETHDLGEIWTACLWDLYWKLVSTDGFNEDIYGETGGNNIALRIIMEGMKIQPCSPGMIDGRDAILAADLVLYDGANQCAIWEVFARRGLGFSANQGSSNFGGDVTEAFDAFPKCTKAVQLKKEMASHTNPGEEFEVKLTVSNYKDETVTAVTIADIIPAGCTYVVGSASVAPASVGAAVNFNIAALETEEVAVLTYRLLAHPDSSSVTQFFDDMENGELNWNYESIETNFSNAWGQLDLFTFSGNSAFAVPNSDTSSDEVLFLVNPFTVTGNSPALRFYSRYDTEPASDGGFLQTKAASSSIWQRAENDVMLRGKYPRQLQYGTFAVPNLYAWSGNSGGWVEHIVDLSAYNNIPFNPRWRYGSDGNTALGDGWFVDNVEFFDLRHYNSEACVNFSGGDPVCTEGLNYGTVVNSSVYTSGEELVPTMPLLLSVQPNPANDKLNIVLSQVNNATELSLYTIDGRLVQTLGTQIGTGSVVVNTSGLTNGMYLVRAINGQQVQTVKVAIWH